jgi:hypothetical protein
VPATSRLSREHSLDRLVDLELHKDDLARLSRRMGLQVFAMHQAVHVAMLVSVPSFVRVGRILIFHIPFTDQVEMIRNAEDPFE